MMTDQALNTASICSDEAICFDHIGGGDLDAFGSLPSVTAAPLITIARRIVAELFGPLETRTFALRYWDIASDPAVEGCAARFTVVLAGPAALRRMFLPPTERALTNAYVRGDFDVEGSLEAASGLAVLLSERLRDPGRLCRLAVLLLRLPRGDVRSSDALTTDVSTTRRRVTAFGDCHTRARDAAAIRQHYDVGNDFYALWLDTEFLVYSCAYFRIGDESLEAAQSAKLEHICRKLRLQPGERLLDIGCGSGGLIRYAAAHFGVDAIGITLSEAQAAAARVRIAHDGLSDRCRVEVMDYRDLSAGFVFDKVASVGMFEHVGRAQLAEYFAAALRLTRPGGLFLNHGIVSLDDARGPTRRGAASRRLWGSGYFMEHSVFPDGELVPLAVALGEAEGAGFETRDVESLREHYATTLRHWVSRLELHERAARAAVGDASFRVWRLYMAACAHAFATAQIGLAQVLLARPDESGGCTLPATRADIYAPMTECA